MSGKNLLRGVFLMALFIILAGQVLNLFLHFNIRIRQILNIVMFCLIGIGYIAEGFGKYHKILRFIMLFSGLFLIFMNFIPMSIAFYIMAVVCLIAPPVIIRVVNKKRPANIENAD